MSLAQADARRAGGGSGTTAQADVRRAGGGSGKRMGRVLILAGSDSGGGAGIQADIKAVTMMGGHAATAITAITVQNTLGVHGVHPLPLDLIAAQARAVLDDIGADAIKTGNTTLQHKVKKAHVELGLEIAKASIVAINPASSVAQVQDEIKALKARIDKVSAYPDLSKDDTATIAYKQTLRKTIHEVRVGRNKNIVGKKDQAVVDTLNKEISKADKVRANAKSTVAQVDTAVDQLRAAYQTALNAPDKAKK